MQRNTEFFLVISEIYSYLCSRKAANKREQSEVHFDYAERKRVQIIKYYSIMSERDKQIEKERKGESRGQVA